MNDDYALKYVVWEKQASVETVLQTNVHTRHRREYRRKWGEKGEGGSNAIEIAHTGCYIVYEDKFVQHENSIAHVCVKNFSLIIISREQE